MEAKINAAKIFKSIRRLHNLFLMSVTVVLIVVSLLSNKLGPLIEKNPETFYALQIALLFMVSSSLFAAFWLPSRIMKTMQENESLIEKMIQYKKAQVARYVILSSASLVVINFFFITAQKNMLIMLAIILLIMVLYRPSQFKAKSDLNLSREEAQELMK